MLATNQNMYNRVLNIQISDDKSQEGTSWAQFFESGSVQKRSYQYEIVEALMEENQALTNRVFFVHFQDATANFKRNEDHPYHEKQNML